MTDRSNESVSALMDGEVTEFELRRTLDRLAQDDAGADSWRRYHIARAAMKGEAVAAPEIDISASVMSALEDEEAFSADNSTQANRPQNEEPVSRAQEWLWKPLTSMAVAASVTAAVIFGAQNFSGQPDSTQIADTRPDYVIPQSLNNSTDFVRAQLGNRSAVAGTQNFSEPDVIRLSEGLSRYIKQHQHMLTAQKPVWQADWLPKGFSNVRHEVMPDAEVMVFSDGRNSFSVCIERFGQQSLPQMAAQSDQMVAVGKRMQNHFVTVVGDVPLMIAERIASSVAPKRL